MRPDELPYYIIRRRSPIDSEVAQWERAGLITLRSSDRNRPSLPGGMLSESPECFVSNAFSRFFFLPLHLTLPISLNFATGVLEILIRLHSGSEIQIRFQVGFSSGFRPEVQSKVKWAIHIHTHTHIIYQSSSQ